MSNPRYSFEFYDLNQNKILYMESINNCSFSQELNTIGHLRFKLYRDQIVQSDKLLTPEKTIIKILRNDIPIQNYLLKSRTKNYSGEYIDYNAESLETFLQDRVIEFVQINNKVKSTAFADLFYDNITKGGYYYFGVNLGTIETAQTSSVTDKFENITLYDLARKLGQTDYGFDFWIDQFMQLNLYSDKKGVYRQNVVLELGKNITNITEQVTGNKLITRLIGLGEKGSVRIDQVNNGAAEAYKVREKITKYKGIYDLFNLQDKVAFDLIKNSGIELNYDIEIIKNPIDIDITQFSIGDWIRIKAVSEIDQFNYDAFKRINRIEVNLDNEYNEDINIEFFEK